MDLPGLAPLRTERGLGRPWGEVGTGGMEDPGVHTEDWPEQLEAGL